MPSILEQILNIIYKESVKKKFTAVYLQNLFKGTQSRSGEGSNLIQTEVIRKEIPALFNNLQIKSIIDSPCGDYLWMREIDLPVEKYIGIDIVKEIVEINQKNFGNDFHSFLEMNIIKDVVPCADIILCRDCLVHLSFAHGIKVIENFKKSRSKYLLTTTFTDRLANNDLGKGFWRPLNLQLSPFHLPDPITTINENCTEAAGSFADKSLGLWLLEDICTNT